METHRPPSSAMRIPTRGLGPDRRPITSRGSSLNSTLSSHSREPMAIPGTRIDEPPPPLPPPRYNEELDRGIDVSWSWQNHESLGNKRHLAPIKPGSSMFGGYMHPRGDTRRSSDMDEMDLDNWDRRESTVSTIRSPSQSEIGAGTSIPSLTRRPPSPTPSNQRLQGERPLAQENFNRSSQAYDQRVLSKIGKPNSPPHHMRTESAENTNLTQKLSLQTRDSRTQRLNDLPSSTSLDPVSRWVSSPLSAGASPGPRPGWRDYNMDHRSPSNESTTTSLVLDPELFVSQRGSVKPSTGSSNPSNDDVASVTSRSQRGSYDHAIFTDQDHEFPPEENNGLRNLNLADPYHQLERKVSRQGMKRRALSPPSETARDERNPTYVAESYQKMSGSNSARSPAIAYRSHPGYGSISSTSSSFRQNSYTSSFAASLTGSSLTSISSYDRQSPSDASLPPQFITSAHPVSSPATSITPSRKSQSQNITQDHKGISRRMSTQTTGNEPRSTPSSRIGNYFICDCCPKKPKKFETEEELRSHQMEKQYACQFCNNRFKNKNEAERHQNSLHLRRQSWSCAAIPSYQAAFHPSQSAHAQSPSGSLSDACGYCGEEFPNLPHPDWERRIDHLTNLHKFGECNQAKKFYRADHFRQHLKHSHAGQSGKWTNMLETVCLREELPTEISGVSPTASDSSQSRGPSSLTGPIPMGGATIDEMQDEA